MITPFLNPADMVDTGAQIAAWRERYPQFSIIEDASDRWDRKANALADDLRNYRARCDAALARTQESVL